MAGVATCKKGLETSTRATNSVNSELTSRVVGAHMEQDHGSFRSLVQELQHSSEVERLIRSLVVGVVLGHQTRLLHDVEVVGPGGVGQVDLGSAAKGLLQKLGRHAAAAGPGQHLNGSDTILLCAEDG